MSEQKDDTVFLCDEHRAEYLPGSCPVCDLIDIKERFEALNKSYHKLIEVPPDHQGALEELLRRVKTLEERNAILVKDNTDKDNDIATKNSTIASLSACVELLNKSIAANHWQT